MSRGASSGRMGRRWSAVPSFSVTSRASSRGYCDSLTANHSSPGRIPMTSQAWHALDAAEVAALLAADPGAGLSKDKARARLKRVGPNRVGEHRERPIWRLVLDQFGSLVVLLLLGAAVVAWGMGEGLEAVAILAALLLNAAVGAGLEWRGRGALSRRPAPAGPPAGGGGGGGGRFPPRRAA